VRLLDFKRLLKGSGSKERIQIFWRKFMVTGLNRSLYWFFNFEDAPLMSYSTLNAIFCVVRFKHIGEMIFSGEFCKNTVNPTPSLF
jgi:hypothetical protein